MTIKVQRIRVILDIDREKPAAVLAGARTIYAGIEANSTLFANPPIPLATFEAQIQELDKAHQVVGKGTHGLADVRNAKRDVLWTTLETYCTYVQSLCDASPEMATTLIGAAGMKAASKSSRTKAILEATGGTQPGLVLLVANASLLVGPANKGKKTTFNWRWSADGGKTWTQAPSTPYANTEIADLPAMTTYLFCVSVTIGKTTGKWSEDVSLLVIH